MSAAVLAFPAADVAPTGGGGGDETHLLFCTNCGSRHFFIEAMRDDDNKRFHSYEYRCANCLFYLDDV